MMYLLALLASAALAAEPVGVENIIHRWDGNYVNPESMAWHAEEDVYFVGNINGFPGANEVNGYINRISAHDGQPREGFQTPFIKGGEGNDLFKPIGIQVYGSQLFVVDAKQQVIIFDAKSGEQESVIPLESSFANDVLQTSDGRIWVTDTGFGDDFQLAPGNSRVWVHDPKKGKTKVVTDFGGETFGPNGIVDCTEPGSKDIRVCVVSVTGFIVMLDDNGEVLRLPLPEPSADGAEWGLDGRLYVTFNQGDAMYAGVPGETDWDWEVVLKNFTQSAARAGAADLGMDYYRNRALIPGLMGGGLWIVDLGPIEPDEPEGEEVHRISGFSTPESVAHDPSTDAYFVSNINGSPFAEDGNGYITKITGLDGEYTVEETFIEGLNAPKGLEVFDGNLYVSDVAGLKIFDCATGEMQAQLPVSGQFLLNDVAVDPNDGMVYITDSGVNANFEPVEGGVAVYVFNNSLTNFATSFRFDLPALDFTGLNGLAISPDQTDDYFAAGVTLFSNEIVWFSKQGEIVFREKVMAQGVFDGIVMTSRGGLPHAYISSWAQGTVFSGSAQGVRAAFTGLDNPADIGLDRVRNRLLVPLFNQNELVIYQLASPSVLDAYTKYCSIIGTNQETCKRAQCGFKKRDTCYMDAKAARRLRCKKFEKYDEFHCALAGCKYKEKKGKCQGGRPFATK